MELLEDMQGAGLGPGMTSYCAAICACEMGELPDVALEILRNAAERAGTPHVIYGAAICACDLGKQPGIAWELLEHFAGILRHRLH